MKKGLSAFWTSDGSAELWKSPPPRRVFVASGRCESGVSPLFTALEWVPTRCRPLPGEPDRWHGNRPKRGSFPQRFPQIQAWCGNRAQGTKTPVCQRLFRLPAVRPGRPGREGTTCSRTPAGRRVPGSGMAWRADFSTCLVASVTARRVALSAQASRLNADHDCHFRQRCRQCGRQRGGTRRPERRPAWPPRGGHRFPVAPW